MTIILNKCPIGYAKMMEIKPYQWCKAFFSTNACCDIIDNNLCEAFNGRILSARCKSIISMLKEIRLMMMTRLYVNRDTIEKWTEILGPRIKKKLHENKVESWNCIVA